MSTRESDQATAPHFVVRSVVGRAGPIFSHVLAVRRHVRMQRLQQQQQQQQQHCGAGSHRAADVGGTTRTTTTTATATCTWKESEQLHVCDDEDTSEDDDVCVHLVAYVHPTPPPPPVQHTRKAAALAQSTGLPLRVQPPALKTYEQATRDTVRRGSVPVATLRMHRDIAVPPPPLTTLLRRQNAHVALLDGVCIMRDQCDDCITNLLLNAADDVARRALYSTHTAVYASASRQRVCAAFGYLVVPDTLAPTADAASVRGDGALSCDCVLMVKELSQLSALASAHL